MNRNIFQFFQRFIILCFIFALYSCANMGSGPGGGAKDVTPPVYKKSTPLPNAVNYQNNKIEIYFDEYIILDNPSNNLIVSPTQDVPPIAKGIGKKVSVELKDSLLPNTSYTLDFGNSVMDNNERNPVPDYTFSFATGPEIDTMMISGVLIHAQNLAPVANVYVGVYSNLEDSAFSTVKLERITKTNAKGNFFIRNLSAKPYWIYALDDLNSNFYFDQKTEGIAVHNEIITPEIRIIEKLDTIYKDTTHSQTIHADTTICNDSLTIDSIVTRNVICYWPDSLLLRFYMEKDDRQYFIKSERPEATRLIFYFKNVTKKLPEITPINFEGDDWLIPEPSITRDTLFYWIKDSSIYQKDTLQLAINYEKTDSLGILVSTSDTITASFKERELTRKEKKEAKEKINFTEAALPSIVESYNKPVIEWTKPLISFGKENVSLTVKEDTLWIDMDFAIERDSQRNSRTFIIAADFSSGKEYEMTIDSAAVTDIYGDHNNLLKTRIKIKSKEEYATLSMDLIGAPEKAFLQLLDKNDAPVMQTPVINGKGDFQYVKPGEYYLRLIADENENGEWDTGNFNEKIFPEEVFYYNKKIKLKANWDSEEEWDVAEIPLLLQRPAEIKNPLGTKK